MKSNWLQLSSAYASLILVFATAINNFGYQLTQGRSQTPARVLNRRQHIIPSLPLHFQKNSNELKWKLQTDFLGHHCWVVAICNCNCNTLRKSPWTSTTISSHWFFLLFFIFIFSFPNGDLSQKMQIIIKKWHINWK